MLAPPYASGPALTNAELAGILLFLVDGVVGPLSAVVLAVALWKRRGGAWWRRLMAAVGILNVGVSGTLLALTDEGLGLLAGLVWLQLAIAVAVVVAALHPAIPLWKGNSAPGR